MKVANQVKKKVAHDIRGPIAGIIGLSQMINGQGQANKMNEVLEVIDLIHKSSKSILELADDILTENEVKEPLGGHLFNLMVFRKRLYDLYGPQAKNKNINLVISLTEDTKDISFPKPKLVQIAGNLISNALKFTHLGGDVQVDLDLAVMNEASKLTIIVQDSGVGIDLVTIAQIIDGHASSVKGTSGEKGYGYGLDLVRRLVMSLDGTMEIANCLGSGAVFKIIIPLN